MKILAEVAEKIGEAVPEDKSLVVSEDVFPESLIIVPLYDRPLFPKNAFAGDYF